MEEAQPFPECTTHKQALAQFIFGQYMKYLFTDTRFELR